MLSCSCQNPCNITWQSYKVSTSFIVHIADFSGFGGLVAIMLDSGTRILGYETTILGARGQHANH
jgi:hypothetical protein